MEFTFLTMEKIDNKYIFMSKCGISYGKKESRLKTDSKDRREAILDRRPGRPPR
jgi:hypothetical protein